MVRLSGGWFVRDQRITPTTHHSLPASPSTICRYLGLNIAWMISYAERHSMGWKHATGVCSICNLIFTALPVTKTSIWLWLVVSRDIV